jgi:hypothetical protein
MAKSSPEKLAAALRANITRRKAAKSPKPPAAPVEKEPSPPKG